MFVKRVMRPIKGKLCAFDNVGFFSGGGGGKTPRPFLKVFANFSLVLRMYKIIK